MPSVPEEGHRDQVSLSFTPSQTVCVLTGSVGRRTRFATFPQVLVVHAKKFQLVNWVPAKLGTSP